MDEINDILHDLSLFEPNSQRSQVRVRPFRPPPPPPTTQSTTKKAAFPLPPKSFGKYFHSFN